MTSIAVELPSSQLRPHLYEVPPPVDESVEAPKKRSELFMKCAAIAGSLALVGALGTGVAFEIAAVAPGDAANVASIIDTLTRTPNSTTANIHAPTDAGSTLPHH